MKLGATEQRRTIAADDASSNTPTASPESLFHLVKMECAAILIERCKNVNLPDRHGHSPLRIASEKGDLEMVKLLLTSPTIELDQRTADDPSADPVVVAAAAAATSSALSAEAGGGGSGSAVLSTETPPPPAVATAVTAFGKLFYSTLFLYLCLSHSHTFPTVTSLSVRCAFARSVHRRTRPSNLRRIIAIELKEHLLVRSIMDR